MGCIHWCFRVSFTPHTNSPVCNQSLGSRMASMGPHSQTKVGMQTPPPHPRACVFLHHWFCSRSSSWGLVGLLEARAHTPSFGLALPLRLGWRLEDVGSNLLLPSSVSQLRAFLSDSFPFSSHSKSSPFYLESVFWSRLPSLPCPVPDSSHQGGLAHLSS